MGEESDIVEERCDLPVEESRLLAKVPYLRVVMSPRLLVDAQFALTLTQETLGQLLGVSRRTMTRWQKVEGYPSIQQRAELARHVHAVKPDLAAQIAEEMGETLVSVRIVEPPPPPQPVVAQAGPPPRPAVPASDLVDSIVCAAAEAVATTPQSIRPALPAAFDRAASVRLAIDEIRAILRPTDGTNDKGDAKKRRPS